MEWFVYMQKILIVKQDQFSANIRLVFVLLFHTYNSNHAILGIGDILAFCVSSLFHLNALILA